MDVGRKSGTSNSIPLSFGALILQTGWGGAGLVMLVFVVSISGTYPIKLIEQIVDSAVNANSRSDILPILTGGALYILTFVIWSGAQYLLNTIYRRIEAEAGHRLRSRLFSHVLHLRPEFFSAYQTGDVTADVLKDSRNYNFAVPETGSLYCPVSDQIYVWIHIYDVDRLAHDSLRIPYRHILGFSRAKHNCESEGARN